MSLRDEVARALQERADPRPWGKLHPTAQTYWLNLADAILPIIETHAAAREAAAVESEEANPWKRAIVELAMVNHTYRADASPKELLHEAIGFDVMAALDPAVSQAARDLIVAERERCAKVAETTHFLIDIDDALSMTKRQHGEYALKQAAAAIRRGGGEG